MSAESAVLSESKPNMYLAILWGGTAAGILDITAAFINSGVRGRSPMWVLQSVASGLFGSESYKGGLKTAASGAALHFFIALVACAIFVLAGMKLRVMIDRPVISGLAYGIVVYCFMYMMVLPLRFQRSFMQPLSGVIIGVLIHMFCVGLPISLVSLWWLKR